MSQILTPGQPAGQPNPLLVLAAAFDSMSAKLVRSLDKLAENTKAKHVYSIAQIESGWGVYCLACSEELLGYIHPCRFQDPDTPAPPQSFVQSEPNLA